ncbi:uncharacterized protein BKA55DRAFT_573961 [Fusarium redolens]|uniref:Uncharacterized protein n=1 Tax=Fusarium redolens TaxID=48865 RepID=A0A9P9K955_FUSRE|nr:uncharacterized protein BKA55DRAFT_573961 [Fusarium redolens]KAH7244469.1 hypothetical protein BKA55DRAFT_573961 [Fusarium redolens]
MAMSSFSLPDTSFLSTKDITLNLSIPCLAVWTALLLRKRCRGSPNLAANAFVVIATALLPILAANLYSFGTVESTSEATALRNSDFGRPVNRC